MPKRLLFVCRLARSRCRSGISERLANSGFAAIQGMNDVSLSCSMMMGIGWNYFCRGLFSDSARWARIMLDFGRRQRDPRSTAIGLWLFAWQAMLAGDYAAALRYAEESVGAASAQVDRMMGGVCRSLSC